MTRGWGLPAWTLLTAALLAGQPARAAPPLFTYPPPARLADGHILQSPQTIDRAQLAALPRTDQRIAGSVLMVYWSALCPTPGGCDFSLIDQALAAAAQAHQRVVLDVVTVGFPLATPAGPQSATPAWALQGVQTYTMQTRILGERAEQGPAVLPDFRDPKWLAAVGGLLQQLQRYDGHPAIARIRIATGMMGEDNPSIGPVGHPINGFTEQDWLLYTRRSAALYASVFKRSPLEFDIGRLSWMAARGSATEHDAVDRFVAELLGRRTLLAFDGLSAACLKALQQPDPRDGIGQSLRLLQSYKAKGGAIGLEAIGPANAAAMRDTASVTAVVQAMQPDRLVLFSDLDSPAGEALLTALGYHTP